jgi:hypothetical protein
MKKIIGLGPPRSGTTWFFENLKLHPEIAAPHGVKETHFWEKPSFDPTSFEKLFDIKDSSKFLLDVSPRYIANINFEGLQSEFANDFFVLFLRDPLSRINSHIRFRNSQGHSFTLDAFRESYWKRYIFIADHIKKLKAYTRPDQLFIVRYETITENPLSLLMQFSDFVGLCHYDFQTSILNEKIHYSWVPRNQIINFLMPKLQRVLRKSFPTLADYLKHSKIIKNLISKSDIQASYLDNAPDSFLHELNEDTYKIQEILKIDLSEWII